ncbi:MAG: alpha/beta fold hydrolase [Acidimicrobiales bacterium]
MDVIELPHPVDGEPAALHDLGGTGPALLLTHGNGLNAGMWRTALPALTQHFHCYGLDFRGHGASRPRHEDFSIDRGRFVDEVLAAVAAIGAPGPIVAAGHSLGGATLLRTEEHHSGTFAGLWLFEPVVIPQGWEEVRAPSMLIEASRRRRMEFDSVEEAYGRFISKPPFSGCQPEAVRAYVEIGTYPLPDGGVRLSCAGETEARIYESNERKDMSQLRSMMCPVVVAAGAAVAAGNDVPPRVAPLIVAGLGNGRLEMMDDLTHFAPMEDGEAVARSIIAHLEPLAGSR